MTRGGERDPSGHGGSPEPATPGSARAPRSRGDSATLPRVSLAPFHRRLLPPGAILFLVAAVGAAAGLCAGLALVRALSGEALAMPGSGGGIWISALSGVAAASPVLAPLLALALVALVAPRFRQAAVARRTRELAEQVAVRTRELARANAELERVAHLDPLTQVANRRVFDRELLGLRESGGRVGLLLADVDRFKSINDRFGHAVGDLVLRAVAEALGVAADGGGLVARLGGDEFALLTPLAAGESPADVASRVVAALERRPLGIPGLEVSVSLGWALAEAGDSKAGLFLSADAALYRAKRGGGGGWSGAFRVASLTNGPSAVDGEPEPDPLSDTADLAAEPLAGTSRNPGAGLRGSPRSFA